MQAMSHAWRCVAFIPSVEFNIHPDFRMLLLSQVFHWCLDMVTASLKDVAEHGIALIDPSRYIHNSYTPLVSYIADLPKQQLIACVARNTSPVTIAEMPWLGDPTPAAP